MSDAQSVAKDPINREHLEEITGGDQEFAEELLVEYLTSTRQTIEQLRGALTSGDPVAVKSAAHAVKGASLSVGADEVSAAARAIEENAAQGSIEGADEYFTRLTRGFSVIEGFYDG